MITEPKYITQTYSLGDAPITLVGEDWGKGLQDTKVTIDGKLVCWISWDTKGEFINDLQAIISKYRI